MSAITFANRNTFISVVAWMLILYGVYGCYSSVSQLIVTVWFYPAPPASVFTMTAISVGLVFSAASLWCGLGILKRQRSRLGAAIFFFWLYIAFSVTSNIWLYVQPFFFSSPAAPASTELMQSVGRYAQFHLANTIASSIRVVVESAAIIWLIGQLSAPMIRDEFEAG